MFKVLIVDDESIIRDGLTTIVDWNQYGFTVAGTAVNGADALQKYEQIVPDLMIVDIRMPGMDGLELVKNVRRQDPWQHFLILSGYADFAYAKRAIEYQVDRYLLKPVEEDELSSYLLELKPKLERELLQRANALMYRLLTQAEGSAAETKAGKENHEKNGDMMLDGRMRKEMNHIGPCRVILLEKADEWGWTPEQREQIRDRLFAQLPSIGGTLPFVLNDRVGFLLCSDHVGRKRGGHRQTLSKLPQWLKSIIGDSSFFAVSGPAVDSVTDVCRSYERALRLLEGKFFLEAGQLCEWPDAVPAHFEQKDHGDACDARHADGHDQHGSQVAGEIFDATQLGEKLFYALDMAEGEAAKRWISEAGRKMAEHGVQAAVVRRNFAQALAVAFSKFNASHALPAAMERSFARKVAEIYEQPHWSALKRHLDDLIDLWMQTRERQTADILVKKMLDFIHRHFHDPLKLETMAELFHYNSAYLGKLFKAHTGENFNTYLHKVRIQKAKELLLQGWKVYEVAERVGYSSVDYFHGKFKKYVGLSPTDFRKKEGIR